MELWIRSQDRTELLKVAIIYLSEYEDYFGIETIDWQLGTYKTKERALEVIDEINRILNNSNLSDIPIYVYEMPKE